MKSAGCFGILLFILLSGGCRSAYCSAWKEFGVYKRDLLKKRVMEARDDQKAAGRHFANVLAHLKEVCGYQGANLEKTYNILNVDYERSVAKASAVHARIGQMETVASDLIDEWEKEIKEISSETLCQSSRTKPQEIRARYDELHCVVMRG
jgi:hypothetical protein